MTWLSYQNLVCLKIFQGTTNEIKRRCGHTIKFHGLLVAINHMHNWLLPSVHFIGLLSRIWWLIRNIIIQSQRGPFLWVFIFYHTTAYDDEFRSVNAVLIILYLQFSKSWVFSNQIPKFLVFFNRFLCWNSYMQLYCLLSSSFSSIFEGGMSMICTTTF